MSVSLNGSALSLERIRAPRSLSSYRVQKSSQNMSFLWRYPARTVKADEEKE